MRVDIATPATSSPGSLAISPDGQKIVYAATASGRSQLWLRSLDSVSALARPLPNTDNAQFPFWAPDSRSIGFFAEGKLKKMDTVSGAGQTLADAIAGLGGTWNRDDTILFSPGTSNAIFRVTASGGTPTEATRLPTPTSSHRFPQFLPDGRHFLYWAGLGTPETRGVYIGQLDGTDSRRLLSAAPNVTVRATYTHSGYLLFIRGDTLLAQTFDLAGFRLYGEPFLVAEHVEPGLDAGSIPFSASAAGPIVYRSTKGQQQFA
jgi:Tol biopolymer transport system component